MPAQLPAIALICLLLYLEEAGLPLPIAPGEVVLLGAGLLIASRPDLVYLVVPLAYGAVLGGVFTAYSWARWIGPKRLRALARRIHAGGPYDRAAARLRAASPLQIAISRLLPGLRVYTSLVAGAVGLGRRHFFGGVMPASALWVLMFIGLGFFVGVPVEHLISRLAVYSIGVVFILVVAVIWIFAARRLPAARILDSVPEAPARWRLPVALAIDLVSVIAVIVLLSVLSVLARSDIDDLVFAAGIFAMLSLAYLLVARYTVGFTLGEALLDIRYHPPRIRRLLPGQP
ncbi:MAG TPA: VTT domain-containing protein [Candidatus Dormibacteraeota bacterium]